jgi:acetyl esterase/lipase
MTRNRASWLVACLWLAAPLVAGEPIAYKEELGVVYAVQDGTELRLDLAIPGEGEGPRPGVLLIHGGGWRAGKREDARPWLGFFAARGYVAASMSYRFAPQHPWPAQIDDARAAVRWLRRNAARHGLDPRRLGAMGFSAGGHLSLMLGVSGDEEKAAATGAEPDAGVQAVVNVFGPTDMTRAVFNDLVEKMLRDLAGGSREEKAGVYRDFSPVSHISGGDAPVLTFQGTKDELVPVDQARLLHEALGRAAIPNRLEILEGRGHGWGGEDLERTNGQAAEFLDLYLGGSDLPLLAAEDFDAGTERWETTDASAWKVEGSGGGARFALIKDKSSYEPPVRSPHNIALLRGVEAADFVLDARVRSTKKDYGHRDLCLFFGYRDPSHFYYAHLAKAADPHAHSVFLVDGKPRVSIATERTAGIAWDDAWHRVRVRREAASGKIEVFFDDLTKPILRAEDRTFPAGRIGIGSFDDTAEFDDIRLRGRKAGG